MSSKKRRSRARARPARTGGRRRSPGVDRRVSVLRRQLRDKEEALARVREQRKDIVKAQQETEESYSRLESQVRTLRDTISAFDAHQAAVARDRQAAEAEIKEAEAEHVRLRRRLNKDARFAAVKNAAASVDRQTKGHRAIVKRLEKRVKKAQREAEEAANEAVDIEVSRRDRREQLRSLPERIRAARVQVATLRAAMKEAADHGRALETYWIEADFDAAVENLRAQTDRKHGVALIESLLEDDAFATARERAEEKGKVLSDLKGQLASAQRDLQNSLQDRERSIKARLDAAP